MVLYSASMPQAYRKFDAPPPLRTHHRGSVHAHQAKLGFVLMAILIRPALAGTATISGYSRTLDVGNREKAAGTRTSPLGDSAWQG